MLEVGGFVEGVGGELSFNCIPGGREEGGGCGGRSLS